MENYNPKVVELKWQNYFDLNRMTTVVVGDKWIIQGQIDKLLKDAKYKDDLKSVEFKKISLD